MAAGIGYRLRERRQQLGLTQATVAAAVGISGSYLNLIEHGKRSIGGALLGRLARRLELDLAALTGAEEARLQQELTELSADPLFHDLNLEPTGPSEIVARAQAWGRGTLRLHRGYQAASRAAEALSARLGRDAYLAGASHELLTRITAVRSFAEILDQSGPLPEAQQRRFARLAAEEGGRAGELAQQLIAYLAAEAPAGFVSSPAEEVDDFIIAHRNYFPALEDEAERLRRELGDAGALAPAIAARLASRHGITTRSPAEGETAAPSGRIAFDPASGVATIPDTLVPETVRFQLARLLFAREGADAVASILTDPRLTTDEARRRARGALASYGAGALLFPYEPFLEKAAAARHDLEVLRRRFAGSLEQICHRLVTLRRPGAEGVPLAFLRVDPAGNVSKRFSLPTLRLPRAGACPLWAVYRAFHNPGAIAAQAARLPDGSEFLFVAHTVAKRAAAFGAPQETYSVMVACERLYADRFVYGDGLFIDSAALRTDVGINCSLCPRECAQRAHPSLLPGSEGGRSAMDFRAG